MYVKYHFNLFDGEPSSIYLSVIKNCQFNFLQGGGGQSGTITTARENNSAVLTSEVLVKYRNPFKSCGRFFSNCTHSN